MPDQENKEWYHNAEFQRIVQEIVFRLDIMMRCNYPHDYVALDNVRRENLYIDKNYNDVRDKLHKNPHYEILEMYKDHVVPKKFIIVMLASSSLPAINTTHPTHIETKS